MSLIDPARLLEGIKDSLWNAEHYRDSQESEINGAYAARRNCTDYYADDDDFMIDIRRRIEAWEHWNKMIESAKKEMFKWRIKYGNEDD